MKRYLEKNHPEKKPRGQTDMVKIAFAGALALLVILVAVFFFISGNPEGPPVPPEEKISLVEIVTSPQKVTPGQTFSVTWKVTSTSPLKIMNTATYFWKDPTGNFGLTTNPQNTGYLGYASDYVNKESEIPGTFSAELTAPSAPGRIFVRAHVDYLGKNYWSDEQAITVQEEGGSGFEEPPTWTGEPLNFVVIYTDDQRWDTLWAMDNVQKELVDKGVLFENTFITTPVCCPSRSSLLSGGFLPINTGVLTNVDAEEFDADSSLAVMLQKKGYVTGLFGKYLNHYRALEPKIPPGWTKFVETDRHVNWFDYSILEGSSATTSPGTGDMSRETQYITDYFGDRALGFIDEHANEKFFVYLVPPSPHKPATPAPGDENKFSDYTYNSAGTDETDLSDKPTYVKEKDNSCDPDEHTEEGGDCRAPSQELFRNQLRSLQSIDRMVKAVVDKLDQKGILDRTVIFFASDNGLMWGEHGLYFKSKPYEESIRVPLVVRMPTVGKKTVSKLVSANLDIPTTILKLVGDTTKTDGLDLYGLMTGANIRWRDGLPFQIFNQERWTAWRTDRYKYVKYENGEKEFYDLQNDPFELESKHNDPGYSSLMAEFDKKLEPFAGLRIDTSSLEGHPRIKIGEPYSIVIKAYGGKPPYKWSIGKAIDEKKEDAYSCKGRLPSGLSVNDNGIISGTPTANEDCIFGVTVTDSSVSPQNGRPQSDRINMSIKS